MYLPRKNQIIVLSIAVDINIYLPYMQHIYSNMRIQQSQQNVIVFDSRGTN